MAKYALQATVYRSVTDTMSLIVDAADEAEAYAKASQVLEGYPQPHSVEGVPFCFVEHRDLGQPHLLDLGIVKELTT